MDVAFFKPCSCRAKNEIDVPADVTIFEILPAAIEQNRVLPADKTAVAKRGAVAIDPDRERLADGPGGVFKRQVLGGKIVVDGVLNVPMGSPWALVMPAYRLNERIVLVGFWPTSRKNDFSRWMCISSL